MLRSCISRQARNILNLRSKNFSLSSCSYKNPEEPSQINKEKRKITEIPLNEEISWLPKPIYANVNSKQETTKITTLSNGLRVASEEVYGNFSTVGVLIDSGSRFEASYPSGISHFLEKLAFGDTKSMKGEQVVKHFQDMNSIIDCQSSRDTLIYATSVEKKSLDKAIELLGEVTLRPLITHEEIELAKRGVQFDLEGLDLSPEKDKLLMEFIHTTAYSNNTLGLPKICPKQNLDKFNRDLIFSYMKHHHSPDRMVIAGVGVDHDKLIELANRHFVEKLPIWEEDNEIKINPKSAKDESRAQYTGGLMKEHADLSNVSTGPNPLPELVHVVLGLESVGHQHSDFVTTCVLNTLMGGGGSFSAGGPGKGMYTRLYRNVLNRYHWIHAATSFNFAYEDTGLFYIQAAAHPVYLKDLLQVIAKETVLMTGEIKTEEFERAKIQLQSMVLMNLESRPVLFEDLGRQVLSTGHKKTPQEYVDLIKNVTKDDLIRVSRQMMKTKPSVVGYGSIDKMPSYSHLESAILTNGSINFKKSSQSLFS